MKEVFAYIVVAIFMPWLVIDAIKKLIKNRRCTVTVDASISTNYGIDAAHGVNCFALNYIYDGKDYSSIVDIKKHDLKAGSNTIIYINPNKPTEFVCDKSAEFKDSIEVIIVGLLVLLFFIYRIYSILH